MATIPKLMTPFQIDRGMPHHLASRLCFAARLRRAMVTATSRKRTRGAAATPGDDPKQPFERGGVAVPVLADDRAVRRAKDEAKGKGGDDRIIELPRDRHEIGDEVDRRGEPDSGESEHDLRADRDATIAEQAGEETGEVGK